MMRCSSKLSRCVRTVGTLLCSCTVGALLDYALRYGINYYCSSTIYRGLCERPAQDQLKPAVRPAAVLLRDHQPEHCTCRREHEAADR